MTRAEDLKEFMGWYAINIGNPRVTDVTISIKIDGMPLDAQEALRGLAIDLTRAFENS